MNGAKGATMNNPVPASFVKQFPDWQNEAVFLEVSH
jgi:hypothetical protein